MADAADSKSVARKGVWVQVPPLVLSFVYSFLQMYRSESDCSNIEAQDSLSYGQGCYRCGLVVKKSTFPSTQLNPSLLRDI